MRLWNGWGNEDSELKMTLNSGLKMLLGALIGPGVSLPQASLEEVVAKVPASRLDKHPLISPGPGNKSPPCPRPEPARLVGHAQW